MRRTGILFLLAAVAVALAWYLTTDRYIKPVAGESPLDLIAGRVYSLSIRPAFSYNYAIQAVFARRVSSHVLVCLTGGPNEDVERERGCDLLNTTMNIRWALSSGGRLIAQRSAGEPLGLVATSNEFFSTLGVIYLHANEHYNLNLRVISTSRKLTALSPRIIVVATTDYADIPSIMTALAIVLVVLLLIGGAISLLPTYRYSFRSKLGS